MEFDMLMKLLDGKLALLEKGRATLERSNLELSQIKEVIRKISEDPYCLYLDENSHLLRYLGFNSEQIKEIEKCKVIYQGYLEFGEKLEQISIVHDKTKAIEEDLEKKQCLLTDIIAKNQGELLKGEDYVFLREEVLNRDSYITQLDTLFELLNGSGLETAETNKIKMAVLTRNNSIHRKMEQARKEVVASDSSLGELVDDKASVVEELFAEEKEDVALVSSEVVESDNPSEYDREILDLEQKLINRFGDKTYADLKEYFRVRIWNCSTIEELDIQLKSYKYDVSVNNHGVVELLDAIMDFERIEILKLKKEEGEEFSEEAEYLKSIAESHIAHIETLKEEALREDKTDVIDVDVDGAIGPDLSGLERAIQNFNSDPLSSPNCVLFLNSSVIKEVTANKSDDVSNSTFCLIEKLRNDGFANDNDSSSYIASKFRSLRGFSKDYNVKELKPLNPTDEARVYCVHVRDNIYVVVGATTKKTDWANGLEDTLRKRKNHYRKFLGYLDRKEDFLAERISNSEKTLSVIASNVSVDVPSKKGGKS